MKHIGSPTISDVPCPLIVHTEVLLHKFCLCSVNTNIINVKEKIKTNQ